MRKPQTINTLTVRVIGINRAHGGWQRRYSMALHREENKVPLYAVAEVQMENPCPRSYIGPEKSQTEGQYGHFVKAEKSEEQMAHSPV